MLVEKLGYYQLEERHTSCGDDRIIIDIPQMQQDIVLKYGTNADVSFVVPCDRGHIMAVLLEFRPQPILDEVPYVFLRTSLTPHELHILKKRFDEILLF